MKEMESCFKIKTVIQELKSKVIYWVDTYIYDYYLVSSVFLRGFAHLLLNHIVIDKCTTKLLINYFYHLTSE